MIVKGNSKGINHNLLCRICIVYAFFRIQQKLLEFSNITAKNHLLCIFFATQTVQSHSKLYRFFLLSYISMKNFSLFLQYSAQLSTLLPYFCNLRNRNDLSSLVRIYIFTKRHDNRANGWIAVVKKRNRCPRDRFPSSIGKHLSDCRPRFSRMFRSPISPRVHSLFLVLSRVLPS